MSTSTRPDGTRHPYMVTTTTGTLTRRAYFDDPEDAAAYIRAAHVDATTQVRGHVLRPSGASYAPLVDGRADLLEEYPEALPMALARAEQMGKFYGSMGLAAARSHWADIADRARQTVERTVARDARREAAAKKRRDARAT